MILIVKRELQIVDHSGGRAKFYKLEPGRYPGRLGPPPRGYEDHEEESKKESWFYLLERTAIGATLDFLRGLVKDQAELQEV